MSNAQQFLHAVLTSETMQQAMKSALLDNGMLTFKVWHQVAAQAGYRFTEAEFEAVFAQEPGLVDKLWALAAAHDIQVEVDDFELNDAELDMIAGGSSCPTPRSNSTGSQANGYTICPGPEPVTSGKINISEGYVSLFKG
jgi:hypothetical protein